METTCNQWKRLPTPILNTPKVPFANCLLPTAYLGFTEKLKKSKKSLIINGFYAKITL
jgi:hypothetical protein